MLGGKLLSVVVAGRGIFPRLFYALEVPFGLPCPTLPHAVRDGAEVGMLAYSFQRPAEKLISEIRAYTSVSTTF